MPTKTEYQKLYDKVQAMPSGKRKTSEAWLGVIKVADEGGVIEQQFQSRIDYIECVSKEGVGEERYFPMFAWLRSCLKENSELERHTRWTALWYYKWFMGILPSYHTVSMEQINNTLLDLKELYAGFGEDDGVYYKYCIETHMKTGHFDLCPPIKAALKKLKSQSVLSDCKACIISFEARYLLELGDLPKALKIAEPILSGKKTCQHVPSATYGKFVIPALKAGRVADARGFVEKTAAILKAPFEDFPYIDRAPLIVFYTLEKSFAKAFKLVEKSFKIYYKETQLKGPFYFYAAISLLLEKYKEEKVTINFPKDFVLHNDSNTYNAALLRNWFDDESKRIATLFDVRNGSKRFSSFIDEIRELPDIVEQ